MKSNVCVIKKGGIGLENILSEVKKVADYNGLDSKSALRLRLLAEELAGMLPELVKNFDGCFWAQNDENKYELHVELSVEELSKEKKQELIAVSAAKKNAAATGFMGRIREMAENLLLNSENSGSVLDSFQYMTEYSLDLHYAYSWSLEDYMSKNNASDKGEEWDQLEKSIVANLADDVIVGIRGKKVDIIIKKAF